MKFKLAIVRNLSNQVLRDPEALMYDALPDFNVTFLIHSSKKDEYAAIKRLLGHSQLVNVRNSTIFPKSFSKICMSTYSLLSKIVPVPPVNRLELSDVAKIVGQVDVVNCNEINSLDARQCVELAANLQVPLTTTVWETRSHANLNYLPLYSGNTRYVSKHSDFLVHVEKARQYLLGLGVPAEKITRISPGLDVKKFSPSSKKDHSNVRILFVGRPANEKGLHFLLRAFTWLCLDRKDVELWIKTSTPEDLSKFQIFGYLNALMKKYPIRILSFGDWLNMPSIYKQCDVFCLPSNDNIKWGFLKIWDEQFGFVFAEAMACGLPIVSTDCGAIPEVIGKENLIVRQKDVKSLYKALKRIVDDNELRERVSKGNRERAEKYFNLAVQKCKLNNYYKSLLNNRKK